MTTLADAIIRARAVAIQHELRRRSVKLRPSGHELVGPCPVCGGTDRFAIHLRKQVWLCRRCQRGGDVVDLVQHLDGVGFAAAVAQLAGDERPPPPLRRAPVPPSSDGPDGRQRALALWRAAAPIAGTIAERYLVETRRLALPDDISLRALRFHQACPFGEGTRHPCLLALYRDIASDEPRAIMRTALTPDGRKIDRKALGPVGGAAIKLSANEDVATSVTLGEGLETTLAAMMKGFSPAWAVGSAAAIAAFPTLGGVEAVIVLAETGDDGANERATKSLASRWLAAGLEVFRATSTVGGDFNDFLMAVA